MKIQTRYFAFESKTDTATEKDFLDKITLLSEKVEIFKTGFGSFVLSIKADFDDNCETENATPSDVIHNFRKKITKVKEYKRKPSPQVHWIGEWEIIKNII